MLNKNKQLSIKQKTILMNIFNTIALFIVCFLFVTCFLFYKSITQGINEYHLDTISCILFILGIAFATLGSNLERDIKKENLKLEIIEIFTSNNSITCTINYAVKHHISLNLVFEALNDFDPSLFQQK